MATNIKDEFEVGIVKSFLGKSLTESLLLKKGHDKEPITNIDGLYHPPPTVWRRLQRSSRGTLTGRRQIVKLARTTNPGLIIAWLRQGNRLVPARGPKRRSKLMFYILDEWIESWKFVAVVLKHVAPDVQIFTQIDILGRKLAYLK